MTARKPALIFIFITLVLDILGIGLIVPILPSLIKEIRGGSESDGVIAYGVVLSIYAIMQFFFAPILGALSDKYGRRKVILISLLGAGLDYFLLAWAPTLAWVVIGRIVAGITSANVSVATAYIADISPPEKRAANFGLVGAAFGLGFVLGPALGGWLGGAYGLRAPFVAAGVLTLFSSLYGLFVLPESLPKEKRRDFSLAASNPFTVLAKLRRSALLLGLAIVYFVVNWGQQVYQSIWALYTADRYEWSVRDIGNSLAAVGIMAIVVQGFFARKLIPKLGERNSAMLGTVVTAIALVGYGLATTGWMIYAIIIVGALGGIVTPAVQGIVSRCVGDDEQGEIQGALTSLQSIASAIGPLVFTAIYSYYKAKGDSQLGLVFFYAAVLFFVSLGLMVLLFRKVPKQTGSDV